MSFSQAQCIFIYLFIYLFIYFIYLAYSMTSLVSEKIYCHMKVYVDDLSDGL
jgi:hypothetical protein